MQTTPLIEINDLVVKYGSHTVLDGITTTIHPGEIRVILGTSGCGKTTLLKTIIGLIPAASGTVTLFGRSIADPESMESVDVLRRVGVLFQNGALLGSLTVGDNVALPLQMHTTLPPPIVKEIVKIKLGQVHLAHAIDLYPGELSGGMRKRAALARALALDPPLLFCDEPSAGLDPVTSAGLDDLLLQLRTTLGITIVVVTHELFSIQHIADRIIFLHMGHLLYDGAYAAAAESKQGPLFDFFSRREHNQSSAPRTSLDFIVEQTL